MGLKRRKLEADLSGQGDLNEIKKEVSDEIFDALNKAGNVSQTMRQDVINNIIRNKAMLTGLDEDVIRSLVIPANSQQQVQPQQPQRGTTGNRVIDFGQR